MWVLKGEFTMEEKDKEEMFRREEVAFTSIREENQVRG